MKIGCVIVLYNPNNVMLIENLTSILDQVNTVFLSDNSDGSFKFGNQFPEKVVYNKNAKNIGIAAAQNIGVKYFLKNNFSYVLFLDQDSTPSNLMVDTLTSDLKGLIKSKNLVGGIGPTLINRATNLEYKATINKGLEYPGNITKRKDIISSGSLIPLVNFKKVGLMEEKLFIDAVDQEWCWRATYFHNLSFFMSGNTFLNHQVGEGDKSFFGFKILSPTPFRFYYLYRNYFILARRKYVPLYWKLSQTVKLLFKMIYFPFFVNPRHKYFKNLGKGIKDGIRNK